MNKPGVSVIVPTFNDQAALSVCIAALLRQDYDGPYEIIVVDNGSDTPPGVPEGVLLLAEVKPGSYNCRNRGMQAARNDIFAFTDADCRPHPQWLSAGVTALRQLNGPGLVGGRVITTIRDTAHPSITELFETAIAFPQRSYIREGRYAATANMLTTRETMEKVGPFDSRLLSGGDKDWGRRVEAAGFAFAYAPDAVLDHPARTSHNELRRKIRRIAGGERDRNPSWSQALRFAARHLLPPRARIRALLRVKGLSLRCRLAVIGYSIFINWIYAFDRIALQLSRAPSCRG